MKGEGATPPQDSNCRSTREQLTGMGCISGAATWDSSLESHICVSPGKKIMQLSPETWNQVSLFGRWNSCLSSAALVWGNLGIKARR